MPETYSTIGRNGVISGVRADLDVSNAAHTVSG